MLVDNPTFTGSFLRQLQLPNSDIIMPHGELALRHNRERVIRYPVGNEVMNSRTAIYRPGAQLDEDSLYIPFGDDELAVLSNSFRITATDEIEVEPTFNTRIGQEGNGYGSLLGTLIEPIIMSALERRCDLFKNRPVYGKMLAISTARDPAKQRYGWTERLALELGYEYIPAHYEPTLVKYYRK